MTPRRDRDAAVEREALLRPEYRAIYDRAGITDLEVPCDAAMDTAVEFQWIKQKLAGVIPVDEFARAVGNGASLTDIARQIVQLANLLEVYASTAAAGHGASVPVEELERLRKIAEVGLRYMWRYAGRERGHLCKPWSPRFLAFDGGEKCDLLGDWEHLRDLLGEHENALAAKAGERA